MRVIQGFIGSEGTVLYVCLVRQNRSLFLFAACLYRTVPFKFALSSHYCYHTFGGTLAGIGGFGVTLGYPPLRQPSETSIFAYLYQSQPGGLRKGAENVTESF